MEKPLSPQAEKALLTRQWRVCLGAPAPRARAAARSGGWGEGTTEDSQLTEEVGMRVRPANISAIAVLFPER
ncbi:hypothetical protein LMG31886_35120 [Xanthomonas hydrangeae]|nr:hypothetical protein LMG31884_36260 [Xanthomonas hydrangeae]CAD7723838.1 hypothetical protein LMG31884_36260 [Xanthomonas hydrangeae]CAD7736683.1 hypothetical protein LMG31885_25280 [Xanthomonas hydrangeae]CAD7736686.1 hypothetical protein LMG31885_25280 [Xanthomonas hydrangeae]CAD7740183.1 hypothetical protein LMG31887_36170 [Xanthomonas hydrangeae]